MVETTLLRWIILLPVVGVVLCIIASATDRRQLARLAGPGVVLGAFGIALATVAKLWSLPTGTVLADSVYTWLDTPPLVVEAALRVDALTSVMILVVTGVGFLIHVYSIGYMHEDPDEARFFAYLNLFTASMLILVLGDSLPVMFLGWEGVGLCSYLLIGFWYTDVANADAGRKAFIANRVGDAAFLIGMFLLFWNLFDLGAPSLRFADINQHAAALAGKSPEVVTAICLLLFVGATGKSAQIPLYVWLPDAMAGPTPVSALIHAATMVTAGVYMIARLSPLFVESPFILDIVAIIGATTALFAATIAIVQKDLKKILAYSTISQLGYMFLGLGVGAFSAGIFHLMTHAFFKALLFLGAGSVMHAMQGELNIEKMGGLKRHMPITRATFLIAALAISGVPLFSGFFSKDMILEEAFVRGNLLAWALGMVAAALTAFYVFRAYFLTFEGSSRVPHDKEHHLHESPASMTLPLCVLAVLSVVGGYVGLPHGIAWGDAFGHYLAPALASVPEAAHHEVSEGTIFGLMALAVGLAVGGIGTAWYLYIQAPGTADAIQARLEGVYSVLWNKYWVDELYDAIFIRPYTALSRLFWEVIDTEMIDGAVNGVGRAVLSLGTALRRLQTGNVQDYALALLIGAVCILIAFSAT